MLNSVKLYYYTMICILRKLTTAFKYQIFVKTTMVTKSKRPKYEEIFEKERASFLKLKKKLIGDPNYRGKYVAIVGGRIVDTDHDKIMLAKRVYNKHGYIPMYIGKVTEKERILEYPSPERA